MTRTATVTPIIRSIDATSDLATLREQRRAIADPDLELPAPVTADSIGTLITQALIARQRAQDQDQEDESDDDTTNA